MSEVSLFLKNLERIYEMWEKIALVLGDISITCDWDGVVMKIMRPHACRGFIEHEKNITWPYAEGMDWEALLKQIEEEFRSSEAWEVEKEQERLKEEIENHQSEAKRLKALLKEDKEDD